VATRASFKRRAAEMSNPTGVPPSVEAMDREVLPRVLQPEEMEKSYVPRVETQVKGGSGLEWIRRPPGKRGASAGDCQAGLSAITFRPITLCIPPERLRAYARRLHRRRVDNAKEIAEPG
jgi:hypothetical protein